MSELSIEEWLESGPIKRETLELWLSILRKGEGNE
jgi:hypothetical protein